MRAGLLLIPPLLGSCIAVVLRMDEDSKRRIAERIRRELGNEFTVDVVNDLFVVASNADEKRTARALRILRRYHDVLARAYFRTAPARPVKVYLFGDQESYRRYKDRAYDEPPDTPFGFYMPGERKIVINIATGPGTLAHELVHPLMETDFPRAPPWFNEGFASLFEESDYTPDGRILGRVNWRIHTLQKALRRPDPPTIRSVAELDQDAFYGPDSGVHYALARYLCLYLQERGVLRQYYRAFRDRHRFDPTGLRILGETLGMPLEAIEEDFRRWAISLRER